MKSGLKSTLRKRITKAQTVANQQKLPGAPRLSRGRTFGRELTNDQDVQISPKLYRIKH